MYIFYYTYFIPTSLRAVSSIFVFLFLHRLRTICAMTRILGTDDDNNNTAWCYHTRPACYAEKAKTVITWPWLFAAAATGTKTLRSRVELLIRQRHSRFFSFWFRIDFIRDEHEKLHLRQWCIHGQSWSYGRWDAQVSRYVNASVDTVECRYLPVYNMPN